MKTVVMVIDVQNDYVHEDGVMNKILGTRNLQEKIPKMNRFLDEMRKKDVEIIHIKMTEGRESIDKNLKKARIRAFGAPENWELAIPNTWGYELMLNVEKNEKIFQKNTYDVFSNPELEKYLKEKNVDKIIFIGAYTHACVESSIRSAMTKGFDLVVVRDLIGSPDKLTSLHESSIKNIKDMFADIVDSEEIIKTV